MVERDTIPLILDNGSGACKAGFAGEDEPSVWFPSIVGRHRHSPGILGAFSKDIYVGEEAQKRRGVLALDYPISRGVVKNWEDMERVSILKLKLFGTSCFQLGRTKSLRS